MLNEPVLVDTGALLALYSVKDPFKRQDSDECTAACL